MKRLAPFFGLVLVAAVLLTWRLGAVYLWQDEAATAVLAERMLTYGKPLAYDGRNLITMDSFADEDLATIDRRTGDAEAALRYLVARGDFKADTTWVGQPWGQFVAAAVSLKILGHGTAQARLPFVLAALLTVVMLYRLALKVFGDDALALVAGSVLVGNAFWILHARQCRYYALSSLGLVLTIAAFLRWQRGARFGLPLFVAAGWIYFQCDFGSFFPTVGVLAVVALVAAWPKIGRPLSGFVALGVAVAPFAWYYALLGRMRNSFDSFASRFYGNLFNVNQYVVAITILALACALAWRHRKSLSREQRMLLWASVGIILATLVWVSAVAPASFHRYVVSLTPLAALLTAWTASRIADVVARRNRPEWARPAALAAFALFVTATGLAAAPVAAVLTSPERPFRVVERPELVTAFQEIFLARPDPNRLVIEAIAPALQPGDEILVNYEDIPFMFYTKARVRGGVAAFRAEDRQAPPPRFLVLRRSVSWVHWPVFEREVSRYRWRRMSTGAPDAPFGNFPDPQFVSLHYSDNEILVAERVSP